MSLFDKKRLPKEIFRIDVDRMRQGWFSDAYFSNIVKILEALAKEKYNFAGECDIPDLDASQVETGDIEVEMQFFTRREPISLVAGVDEALAILQECAGFYDEEGNFVNTYHQLAVEAVEDGTFAQYGGKAKEVQPVLRVRGRYRDFANLETPILGSLTEATKVATNVYNVLVAAGGKDVLFFPARFAHYKLQALHGYAYSLAVKAYNHKFGKHSNPIVSTDDQGGWWGGRGGGTVAHSAIACFLGDAAENMLQFCRTLSPAIPRIALVDFHNDCVSDTLKVMAGMYKAYSQFIGAGKPEEAKKYKLFGVRTDTSGSMRDKSVPPLGNKDLDMGVNPRLVWILREAIDNAWREWNLSPETVETAKEWCQDVKIVVTGGFDVQRISLFEELGVPVDIYGVGSSLLNNCNHNNTKNDFTADIVGVKVGGNWYSLSKTGRARGENPNLQKL